MIYIMFCKYVLCVFLFVIVILVVGFVLLVVQVVDSVDVVFSKVIDLDKVQVCGSWFNLFLLKFIVELLDIFKLVLIVLEKLIVEIGVINLQDVLCMVLGIIFGVGEGGNLIGDCFFICGFDLQSNVFVDGLCDVGLQICEIFDLEQVEVVKGLSLVYGGCDFGGGSLNLVSKMLKLKNEISVSMGIGIDSYVCGIVDVNYVLGDGIVVCLNLMKYELDIVGCDVVNVSCWGVVLLIVFGLNGLVQLIVSYYYMQSDDLLDVGGFFYGNLNGVLVLKWVDGCLMVLDCNNYYGLVDCDFQCICVDISIFDVSYDFGGYKLCNIVCLGNISNDYLWIQLDDSQGNLNNYGILWCCINSCVVDVKSFVDQLGLIGVFQIGVFKYSYSVGVEYSDEKMIRGSYLMMLGISNLFIGNSKCLIIGVVIGYNCIDFVYLDLCDLWVVMYLVYCSDKVLDVEQCIRIILVYVFDIIEFNEQWMINFGLCYDDFCIILIILVVGKVLICVCNSNDFLNYQVGVVFKLVVNGSIYLLWGIFLILFGMDGGDGLDGLSVVVVDFKLQDMKNFELGIKWDFFDQCLNLIVVIFYIVMNNVCVMVDNGISQNVGKKEINGFELGFIGQLIDVWSLYGGYIYLDLELKDNGFVCGVLVGCICLFNVYVLLFYNGNVFLNIVKYSVNLWIIYCFLIGLIFGVGVFYLDKQYGDVVNIKWILSYICFDVMVSYVIQDNISLQFNVQNLIDKIYFIKVYVLYYVSIVLGCLVILVLNVKF